MVRPTAQSVAQYLYEVIEANGELARVDAVAMLERRFGRDELFASDLLFLDDRTGNIRIGKGVQRAFRPLKENHIEWTAQGRDAGFWTYRFYPHVNLELLTDDEVASRERYLREERHELEGALKDLDRWWNTPMPSDAAPDEETQRRLRRLDAQHGQCMHALRRVRAARVGEDNADLEALVDFPSRAGE